MASSAHSSNSSACSNHSNSSESSLTTIYERSIEAVLQPYQNRSPSAPLRLSEAEVRQISDALRSSGKESWSKVPRIYAILHIIQHVKVLDAFIKKDVSDFWFPFSHKTLPDDLRNSSARCQFLELQDLVLTKAVDLEREDGKHRHFSSADDIPLQTVEELGQGGFGVVDRVLSTITGKEYARKVIPRGKTFKKNSEIQKTFEQELAHLKKLSHRHIVKFVGSYTDPMFIGILMHPVADCNLHAFLSRDNLSSGDKSFLRTFYGCLATALCYLHENKVRHKDIKPQNVLVKRNHVYLTDFGTSLDWSDLDHGTTTGISARTPRYCAPEVAQCLPRNSAADVWSLGCVFLEMWTVLKGKSLSQLFTYMSEQGSKSSCYHLNLLSVNEWCDELELRSPTLTENHPLKWIKSSLQIAQEERWTAKMLAESIIEMDDDDHRQHLFYGRCCMVSDECSGSNLPSRRTSRQLDETGVSSCEAYDPASSQHKSNFSTLGALDCVSHTALPSPVISRIVNSSDPKKHPKEEKVGPTITSIPFISMPDYQVWETATATLSRSKVPSTSEPNHYDRLANTIAMPHNQLSPDSAPDCGTCRPVLAAPPHFYIQAPHMPDQSNETATSRAMSYQQPPFVNGSNRFIEQALSATIPFEQLPPVSVPSYYAEQAMLAPTSHHPPLFVPVPEHHTEPASFAVMSHNQPPTGFSSNPSTGRFSTPTFSYHEAQSCFVPDQYMRYPHLTAGPCYDAPPVPTSAPYVGHPTLTAAPYHDPQFVPVSAQYMGPSPLFTAPCSETSSISLPYYYPEQATLGTMPQDERLYAPVPLISMPENSTEEAISATIDRTEALGYIPANFHPAMEDSGTERIVELLWEAKSGQEGCKWDRFSNKNDHSLAFSPNGSLLVSAVGDGSLQLMSVVTGREARRLKGHKTAVCAVAFSPNGMLLASASQDSTRLWEVETGEQLQKVKTHRIGVSAVAFSPGGSLLVSASASSFTPLQVWDVQTSQRTQVDVQQYLREPVALSPDGSVLASNSLDNFSSHYFLGLWEVKTGQKVQSLAWQESSARRSTFSPDGLLLATAGLDSIGVWEVKTGRQIQNLVQPMCEALAFSPDGSFLASAWRDNFRLWDVKTGQYVVEMYSDYRSAWADRRCIRALAFKPDGPVLALAFDDYTVQLRRIAGLSMRNAPKRAISDLDQFFDHFPPRPKRDMASWWKSLGRSA